MKKLTLRFLDNKIEKEYIDLRQAVVSKNHLITLYFLLTFIAGTGIPEAIDGNFPGFFMSLGCAGALILIAILAKFFKVFYKYANLLSLFVMYAFNFSRFFFFSTPFDNMTLGLMYFRGYSFASLQFVLISRFFDFKHKVLGMLIGFFARFFVVYHFDKSIVRADLIIRHIIIDGFIIYNFYSSEKQERQIFHNAYKYREGLNKFKELLADYLPQSVTILKEGTAKPLFCNRAFLEVFHDPGVETVIPTNQSIMQPQNTHPDPTKISLESLKIEKSIVKDNKSDLNGEDIFGSSNLKEIVETVAQDKSALDKTWILTGSYDLLNPRRLFEILLKKIKWDEQEALAAIVSDITHQEHMIALKIADSNKDKILATVSHELRTPLNAIINILQICEKKVRDKQVLDHLDLCKDNATLLMGLVNSLLDLQQISKGKLQLNPTRTNIHKVLEDMVRLFSFQAKKSNISLAQKIDPEVPIYISTDENRLKQILINLIGNALKFTFQGEIVLQASVDPERNNYLQISVSDTGIGISKEDQGKLFKMYGRLEDKEGVNKTGVGLGLTVVSALATALGGGNRNDSGQAISLESKVGIGSRFTFWILTNLQASITQESINSSPRRANEVRIGIQRFESDSSEKVLSAKFDEFEELLPAARIESKISDHIFTKKMITQIKPSDEPIRATLTEKSIKLPQFTPRDEQKRKALSLSPQAKKVIVSDKLELTSRKTLDNAKYILAVDDNPFNLLVAENMIKEAGYIAVTARGGLEAIGMAKTLFKEDKSLKVVLMDCQMPLMDGFETTKILKHMMEKKEMEKVPIVALTANTEPRDKERCFECGMDDYLPKPLMMDSFLATLAKFEPSKE